MTDETSRVGTTLGPYRIDALLGRGGMGEVYQAYDTVKDRTVALKLLSPHLVDNEEFRSRFMTESRTAARLSEPHIIPIHDFGEIDGLLFIDMRLVEGEDLRTILKKGPIPPARAANIVSQIANALDAAHRGGLVHRDVKPDNILIDENDFAYLVDFGIAHGVGDTSMTIAGTALGSLAYMAPERFGDQQAGPAADTYSLACVFYESLTGRQPFVGSSTEALITAHLTKQPPTIGIALDPVITFGMGKDPTSRYGSTKEFARAISRAVATMSPAAQNTVVPQQRATSASQRPTAGIPPQNQGPAPIRPVFPGVSSNPSGPSGPSGVPRPSGPQHAPIPQRAPVTQRPPVTPAPTTPAVARTSGPQYTPNPQSGPTPSGPQNQPVSSGFAAVSTSGPVGGSAPLHFAGLPPNLSGPQGLPPKGKSNTRTILIVAAVALLVVILGTVGIIAAARGGDDPDNNGNGTTTPPAASTVSCTYRTAEVKGPTSPKPAALQPNTGTSTIDLDTSQGSVAMTLNHAKAPCNSGAVKSLAKAGYYDNTTCHRLSTIGGYLICGDPTGSQAGSPGWASPDELPKDLTSTGKNDSKGRAQVTYPRGTIAIVNTDPTTRPNASAGTGAAMFILTTKPMDLTPLYSVVGTLDDASLAILDRIVAGGFTPAKQGDEFGRPTTPVVISTATVKAS